MMKEIYFYDEVDEPDEELLGGKGANLCEMAKIGLPIPPGFVISTKVCREYQEKEGLTKNLMENVRKAVKKLEEKKGEKFGDSENPLLMSVRSGAAVSMPGMMDTVLNIGLNDETVEGLSEKINERFAFDTYRRLLQMFGSVILGIDEDKFGKKLSDYKAEIGAENDADLEAKDFKKIVDKFKKIIKNNSKKGFPQDLYKQLEMAIIAVFDSCYTERAIEYKKAEDIPEDLGTAVNVVSMIFGNADEESGSGVMFTRNPSTGEKELYGEFLYKAQGEDVVAGVRTPLDISELEEKDPEIYKQLSNIAEKLENHYREMQDIEFTVEQGDLYVLQTRDGKRTSQAAVKIAVDMVEEGLIDKEEAVDRVETDQLRQLLSKQIDPEADLDVIAQGIGSSPGVGIGEVVFSVDEAIQVGGEKEIILVRPNTSPSDISGVRASEGVLTSEGGKSSHAAIISREIGKPAVVGCEEIEIDLDSEKFESKKATLEREDVITIDGSSGEVIRGKAPLVEPEKSEELEKILSWRKEVLNR